MTVGLSKLAERYLHHSDVPDRKKPVQGAVVHTTGSGVVERARKLGADPAALAAEYYLSGRTGGHYVIAYSGTIFQIADEHECMWHAGIGKDEQPLYRGAQWQSKVSPATKRLWRERWFPAETPRHWLPPGSVNDNFVGVELVPLVHPDPDGYWSASPDETFTLMQYESLIGLLRDIARRWNIWSYARSVIVGHEDVNPLTRSDRGGGWDPGSLRDRPRFNWGRIWSRL